MFNEKTTTQNRRQMDGLICHCNESKGFIVTQYLMSFVFGCATGEYIVDLFLQLRGDEFKQKFLLPRNTLANLFSDLQDMFFRYQVEISNATLFRKAQQLQVKMLKGQQLISMHGLNTHSAWNLFLENFQAQHRWKMSLLFSHEMLTQDG